MGWSSYIGQSKDKNPKSKSFRKKSLSQIASAFCDELFSSCPVIQNELINKDKISGNVSSARKKINASNAKS